MTRNRARLAKIKQDQAKSISNRAKPLGRESIPLSDMPDTVDDNADCSSGHT